ncbi:high mobility group box domain-containing protein, partial [Coniochaeta sp. 2T2.1]
PVKVETHDVATVVVAKRKYRRHPKPDENAPERPPSAYVLFSNKMRDDLKGRNLTLTKIAKLVGEHWQGLSVAEKEPFESQAQAAKDKYNNQLTKYKKTPAYERYQEYLEEFKNNMHISRKSVELTGTADKDATKREKLSPGASDTERRTTNSIRPSKSGGGSPSANARTGDRRRHHRLSSVVSAPDSPVSAMPAIHPASLDDAVHSPLDCRSSEQSPIIRPSPRDVGMTHRRTLGWHDDQSLEQSGPPRLLPSLSDVFDPHSSLSSGHSSTDLNGYPFPSSYSHDSAGPPPELARDPG